MIFISILNYYREYIGNRPGLRQLCIVKWAGVFNPRETGGARMKVEVNALGSKIFSIEWGLNMKKHVQQL